MRHRGLLRLGRVLGVPVLVAPSWFVLAVLVVALYGPSLQNLVADGGRADGYLAAAGFAVLLLISILLHEIGHAVVARLYGLPVKSITITFLAGSTEITEPPQTPAREYAIAVVGPMVSLLLGALAAAGALLLADGPVQAALQLTALTNGAVAVFNLLPGLPLDGGRVLRSALWRVTGDPDRAQVLSAQAGRVLALAGLPLLVLVVLPLSGIKAGLGGAVLAALVAGFLFTGATAALRQARLTQRLPGLSADLLARRPLLVPATTSLAEALRRTHEARLHAMVVVDPDGRPLALVSEKAVAEVPEQQRPWTTVDGVSRQLSDALVLTPALSGRQLLARLQAEPAGEYLVRDPAGGPVRVLSAKDVAGVLSGASPPAPPASVGADDYRSRPPSRAPDRG